MYIIHNSNLFTRKIKGIVCLPVLEKPHCVFCHSMLERFYNMSTTTIDNHTLIIIHSKFDRKSSISPRFSTDNRNYD